ncbi:THAP domain-containing protein 5-like isoform X3 [Cydia pomonella]|uniref:THAP domain-containing protein 5-like isoform X3 n=1 Tax=Cydia pomonella TaxID=82600 RepID=UPI002ADDCDF9|nr:THAP domain-containing protein 5-like isoform X3 [Cydia pomonella]
MPSCVVKCCKNDTGRKNKSNGVTFHLVHKDDKYWTNRLVKIIRKCRYDNDWVPSKSSVICSVHFDDNDFYTTKHGRRYLVNNALPKKFLELSSRQEGTIVVTNCFQTNILVSTIEPAELNPSVVKLEQLHTSGHYDTSPELLPEPKLELENTFIQEEQTSNLECTIDLQGPKLEPESTFIEEEQISISETTIGLQEPKLEPESTFIEEEQISISETTIGLQEPKLESDSTFIEEEQTSISETTIALPQSSCIAMVPATNKPSPTQSFVPFRNLAFLQQVKPVEEASDINIENPLSVLYPPKEQFIKEAFIKKEITIRKLRQQLRSANQRIKRLQSKNETLKEFIRSFKKNVLNRK